MGKRFVKVQCCLYFVVWFHSVLLQAGPLDLLTDEFYCNRKEMIDTRLKWIQLATSEVCTYTYHLKIV